MIQIAPQMQIWLAVEAVDFRRGIDGLARECREWLKTDPFSGLLFVFGNKRGTAPKISTHDLQCQYFKSDPKRYSRVLIDARGLSTPFRLGILHCLPLSFPISDLLSLFSSLF